MFGSKKKRISRAAISMDTKVSLASLLSNDSSSTVADNYSSSKVVRKQEVKYLESLISECKALLGGDNYVNLSGTEYESKKDGAASDFITGIGHVTMHIPMLYQRDFIEEELATSTENVCDCILDNTKTVLLGEPGCGKTTAMLQIALNYAQKAINDPDCPIPVFVPLGSYKDSASIEQFIITQMPYLSDSYHIEQVNSGRFIILFDALNETIYEKKSEVLSFIKGLNAFIVSCRTLDYEREFQNVSGVSIVKILDLDPNRIKTALLLRFSQDEASQLWKALGGNDLLIKHWEVLSKHNCQNLYWDPNSKFPYTSQETDAAWEQMHKHGILPVCRNPLMLSMVCDLFRYEKLLPENRGKLFERFIEVCLDSEITHQATLTKKNIAHCNKNSALQMLSIIAITIHKQKLGTGILYNECEKVLLKQWKAPEIKKYIELSQSAGIIQLEHGQIRFSHQLIQEYFAGEALRNAMNSSPQIPASEFFDQTNWWETQGWEETAVILAGTLRSSEFDVFVKWIASAQPALAIRCIERCGIPNISIGTISDDLRQYLRLIWEKRISEASDTLLPRSIVAEMLGIVGDTRPGTSCFDNGDYFLLPEFLWCNVDALESLEVSKYPVTVQQFNSFINADDGYCCDKWWDISEESFQWHLTHLNPFNSEVNIGNCPKVDICWFEAVAFCRWCSSMLNETIRLPSIDEWEKVGLTAKDYSTSFSITLIDHIDKVVPVGIYTIDHMANQANDLFGNAWEWTSDSFLMLSGHATSDNVSNTCVLKGGSWKFDNEYADYQYRFYAFPNLRRDDIGFRVIREKNIT